nr:transposase [uncultured bacterium]
MANYETGFKLKVVNSFLAGNGGAKLLSRQWSVPEERIRTWVSHYRLHGIDGLRPKRSVYSAQFKLQVLSHQDGEQLSSRQVAAFYDIRNPNQVVVWRRQLDTAGIAALESKQRGRPDMKPKLCRPVSPDTVTTYSTRDLREKERTAARGGGVLKKIARLDPDEKISCVDKAHVILGSRRDHKLAVLLQVADLARSTFYYQRQAMQCDDKHGDMKTRICAVYAEHKGRYGYRRIAAALCNCMAQQVKSKPVQRLMQQMGLRSLIRAKRRYRHTHGSSDVHVPNVLQRDFHAETPNQKWATDITEFSVKGQKVYLSACMDLYKGEIIAQRLARRPIFDLVSGTLEAALSQSKDTTGLTVHSDQGWHYKMQPYRAMLAHRGVTQSMRRKGNCLDNAVIESFFGTLKAEFFHLAEFDSVAQLEAGVHDYIRYYNYERIKLGLQGLSPVEYRLRNIA